MSELTWKEKDIHGYSYHEAILGDFDREDGVRITLTVQPTCHRRGRFRLLIEVADKSHKWGCFDNDDQPMRYYHDLQCALSEAESIAQLLIREKKS